MRTVPGRTVPKGNFGSKWIFIKRKVSKQRRGEGFKKSQQKTDFFILMASLRAYPIISLSIIYINSQNKSHIKNQYIFGMHGTIIPFHSNTLTNTDKPCCGQQRDFLIYLKIFGILNAENILLFKKC